MTAVTKIPVDEKELSERLALSRKRLCEPFYAEGEIFSPNPGWPGDKEGRALLAFVCLAAAGEEEIPCMRYIIDELPNRLNEKGYLGEITDCFFEQQLSGHSWLLRGLCAYFEKYGGDGVLKIAKGIVENLYLPLSGKIKDYPVLRRGENDGGVEGHTSASCDGWLLSTDTCCAFMSIDGLSHYYQLTRDEKVLSLLDELCRGFMLIDKQKIKAQTHCTLTAARGMVRLFTLTGNALYLAFAREILSIYKDYGMTLDYENFNWWGRPDTWTEPCAVVDSLMLSCELYKLTGDKACRTLAARIFHNGFAAIQRPNGGAGTMKIVCPGQPVLKMSGYEARQCCTMRFAEGLRYVKDNREFLFAETEGEIIKDENGVYRDGDIIYAETVGEEEKGLHPLIKYYKLTKEQVETLSQRVISG